MKQWTVTEIKVKLATDNQWLERGIQAIYKRQTEDEKAVGTTVESNGVGFNGCDANILSSFAEQLNQGRHLSKRQLEIARPKMVKYAKQLKQIADAKRSE